MVFVKGYCVDEVMAGLGLEDMRPVVRKLND